MPRRGDSKTEAAEALVTAALLATRWIERVLARQHPPLTVTQYLALRAIEQESIGGTELARRAGVSSPAVSQLLAGLADAGLIERRPTSSDRRRQALVLTSAGKRAFKSAEAVLAKRLASLLSELPRPEAAALSRALPQVEAALSGAPPPRRPAAARPPGPPRPEHRHRNA